MTNGTRLAVDSLICLALILGLVSCRAAIEPTSPGFTASAPEPTGRQAPAATEPPPPSTNTPAPVDTPEPIANDSACVTCHTSRDMLAALVEPEEPAPDLSQGEG